MKTKIAILIVMTCMASLFVNAQPFTVFASGFTELIGISRDANGNLLVAEAGTGANDSRISLITPSATVYPLVTDLPSFLDTLSGEISGAWRAEMISSDELMIVVGGGTDTNAGSLMFFNINGFVPGTSPAMTPADADSVLHVSNFVYGNGFMDSNPFSAAMDQNGNIYVADAGANAVIKYEVSTQTFSVLDTFPAFPNPFGGPPPAFDYVPTRIISEPGGGFYMGNLGAFVPGLGRIISLDVNGTTSILDTGFSAVVDIQYDPVTGNRYVLEFGEFDSTFTPVMGSAKIFRIDNLGNKDLLYTGFGPSSGFVLDGNGGAYVTEIVTGNVLYFADISSAGSLSKQNILNVSSFPNPFTSSLNIDVESKQPAKAEIQIKNVTGQIVYSAKEMLMAGENKIYWNGTGTNNEKLPAGNYFISVITDFGSTTIKTLKQ